MAPVSEETDTLSRNNNDPAVRPDGAADRIVGGENDIDVETSEFQRSFLEMPEVQRIVQRAQARQCATLPG